jgi:hypothetical protein
MENVILGCWMVFSATFVGAWLLLKGTSDPQPLSDRLLPHGGPLLAVTLAGLALALRARSPWAEIGAAGSPSRSITS